MSTDTHWTDDLIETLRENCQVVCLNRVEKTLDNGRFTVWSLYRAGKTLLAIYTVSAGPEEPGSHYAEVFLPAGRDNQITTTIDEVRKAALGEHSA